MDTIKESDALQRLCPHTTQNCVGAHCMAWRAERGLRVVVEIDWPADLARPEVNRLLYPEPREYAAALREAAAAVLKPLTSGTHADTGRRVVEAVPLDIQMTKVRLTLEAEAAGTCSLFR